MITAALLLLQAAMPGSTVATRVESILARSPVPREGEVAVITSASADAIYAGDQLEVLTTAWFPAAVRERLRRPPTLRPPSLSGVWSLPVITLPGVAASRTIGETVYDLFASHQVVFPVAAGRLVIPAAELGFSLPGGRQFFGDERRDERRSAERVVTVLPLPAAGRPPGFAGPVARDLRIAWRVATPNARVGELLTVDILVGGEGSLSLWGAPEVEWPAGVRVYPDRVDEAPEWRGSRLGGIRRFRFLLLADSAGSVTLPALRYGFFDPLARGYRTAAAPAMVVPILPSVAPAQPRTPPALLPERPAAWPRRLVDQGTPILLLLLAAGPLLVVAAEWRRRRAGSVRPPVAQALVRFERLLDRLVGETAEREPAALAASLRRAGLERSAADGAAHLHERLRQLRFARPEARPGREGELAEEAARWFEGLPEPMKRLVRPGGVAALVLLALALPTAAQAPSPSELYAGEAWEAAVQAQHRVARAAPTSATAWFNYGAALWMARRDGEAAAAWLHAYQLAPRNGAVRRAWDELALSQEQVRALAPAVPVTAEELMTAGAGLWLAACVLLAGRPARRRLAGGLALVATLAGATGVALRVHRAAPTVFTTQSAPLRLSPHGLADVVGTVDGFAQVPLEAAQDGWVRVRDHAGRRGWLPAAVVASPRGLD